MSIYARGDTWHYDFVLKGVRHRGSTHVRAKTKKPPAEVVKHVAKLREQAALGGSPREVETIRSAAYKWFSARRAGSKGAKSNAYHLEIMLRIMGPDTLITEVDEAAIVEGIQKRRLEIIHPKRKSSKTAPTNSTINRDLIDSSLRPILRYAKRVLKQPVHEIEWREVRLTEPKERTRTFSEAELSAWRANLPEAYLPLFDFFATYGVRLTEAFFDPSQVDVAAGRVTLRDRKNGKDHTLPLLPADATAMAARVGRAHAAGLTTVWFRELKGGVIKGITRRGFQQASKTALDRAGIVDARPAHDLRHHAATTALRRSGNLAVVKQLLGHDNIASTMRYAHVGDADVLAALGHESPHTSQKDAPKPLTKKRFRTIVRRT